MARTKRAKSLLCVLFVSFFVPVVLLLRPSGLLGGSELICDARGWNLAGDEAYLWLSNDALIYFRQNPSSDCGDIVRRNLLAHTDTDLPAVTELWSHACGTPIQAEISPDHRWILSTDGDNPLASMIDGKQSFTWNREGDAHWLCDSQRVAVFTLSNTETVTGVSVLTVAVPNHVARMAHPMAFPLGSTARITADNHLLTTGYYTECKRGADVSVYDVDLLGTGQIRRFVKHFPRSKVAQAAFSADGTRIAWLTECTNDSVSYALIRRFMHSLGIPKDGRVSMGLCVTRVDGSRMVDLGEVYCKPGEVKGLSWLPDDRHISFVYRNGLFETVAPP